MSNKSDHSKLKTLGIHLVRSTPDSVVREREGTMPLDS